MEKLKQKTVEQYSIREGSPVNVRWTVRWVAGGKDFWIRCALSLDWKRVGVIDGESGGDGAGRFRRVE